MSIWLAENGANLDWTNTEVTVLGNHGKFVAAWNFVVEANDNDYFELMWSSADQFMQLTASAADTGPTRPGIPSVIVTVTQVH